MSRQQIFIGLDWSLTSPGIVTINGEEIKYHFLAPKAKFVGKIKPNLIGYPYPEWSTDIERYSKIAKWALSVISEFDPEDTTILLEGFSFGSKGRAVFNIAENAGVLKFVLTEAGYTIEVVPPTVIKKFATGKGNANKDLIGEQFVKDTGWKMYEEFGSSKPQIKPCDDLIDAYYIAKYAQSPTKQSGDPSVTV